MSRPESPAAKKIAVFADVQNLYYTVRQAYGCHLNYAALWADIARGGSIVEAYAYAIDRGDPRQQQFQQILRNLGFTVKLKPYIQRADGSAKGTGMSASPSTYWMPRHGWTKWCCCPVTATSICCWRRSSAPTASWLRPTGCLA